jgi:hypothetical protein
MGYVSRLIPRGLVVALLLSAMLPSSAAIAGPAGKVAHPDGGPQSSGVKGLWLATLRVPSAPAAHVGAVIVNDLGTLSGLAINDDKCLYSITGTLGPANAIDMHLTQESGSGCPAFFDFTGTLAGDGTHASGTYTTDDILIPSPWVATELL